MSVNKKLVTKLGYASDSLTSSMIMLGIDLLNPLKRHYPFKWDSPCVISSIDGLGDLIIQLPLIAGLVKKAGQYNARVEVALRSAHLPIGEKCGWNILHFENPIQHFFKGTLNKDVFAQMRRVTGEIRKERKNLWIDLSGNGMNAMFLKMIGIKRIASKTSRGGKSFIDYVIPHSRDINEYEYQRSVADFLECEYDTEIYKKLLDENFEPPAKSYILTSVSTPCRWKTWPINSLIEVVKALPKETFALTGLRHELLPEETDDLKELTELPNVVDLIGKVSLPDVFNLTANAKAVLTNDTSTLHIANAYQKPGTVIFGPSESKIWSKPDGVKHFHSPDCPFHPCRQWNCDRPDNWCMLNISPREVIEHLQSL